MYFFFFKQKTAYEMRISDWSSDVCSSDLDDLVELGRRCLLRLGETVDCAQFQGLEGRLRAFLRQRRKRHHWHGLALHQLFQKLQTEIGRASCRERVCQYV